MTIEKYEQIESTHKYLKENYKKYTTKTVIIANKQISGIGTKGSSWFTGNNENIAMSILYKPECEIADLNGLTLKSAEIIKEGIKDLYDVNLEIKEPNDLMLNNKKICGILTEINTIGNKINYLIISIGFNVNEINFPKELENIATSLKKEFNRQFEKERLIQKIIKDFENII